MSKLLLTNIGMLATPLGKGPRKGAEQGEIQILRDAWVLCEDGVIAQVGTGPAPAAADAQVVDAQGSLVTPGLVDAHTHLVFGGWRQNELGDLSVDILLDASASQNQQQEKLSTQAYLIAAALTRCRIPVRVSSFCSVSGCTVLRVYRDYQEDDRNDAIFDYVSAGWNRDGLALRAMGWLMEREQADHRLLILLSDANPNDDQKIPNEGLLPGGRDYGGKLGVKDTAAEAGILRRRGLAPVCIFTGSDRELPGAREIYGRELVIQGGDFAVCEHGGHCCGRCGQGERPCCRDCGTNEFCGRKQQ